MKKRILSLTSLAVFGLATAQTASDNLPRIDPATLQTLARSANGNDQRSAEALSSVVTAKQLQKQPKLAVEDQTKLVELARRQLAPEMTKSFGPSTQILVGGQPVSRTPLAGGAVLYGFGGSSAILVPVRLSTDADEAEMIQALGKAIFKVVRIPASAQRPVTGSLIRKRTGSGTTLWSGALFFGYTPDANGVYKISDPKWHDDASAWTDGEYLWIHFSRDDLKMGAANGNPSGPTRKGGG